MNTKMYPELTSASRIDYAQTTYEPITDTDIEHFLKLSKNIQVEVLYAQLKVLKSIAEFLKPSNTDTEQSDVDCQCKQLD